MKKSYEAMLRELHSYFHERAKMLAGQGNNEAKGEARHARDMVQAHLDELEDEKAKDAADRTLSQS